MDPHQIAVTLNWIFNVSTEPVIEFLLSVAHDIYQKSATTNQNQQQPWWNCGFLFLYRNLLSHPPFPKKREHWSTGHSVHIKSDKCVYTSGLWPVCSHIGGSSVVRGLTNWFSDHLGVCVPRVMLSPRERRIRITFEAQNFCDTSYQFALKHPC